LWDLAVWRGEAAYRLRPVAMNMLPDWLRKA